MRLGSYKTKKKNPNDGIQLKGLWYMAFFHAHVNVNDNGHKQIVNFGLYT